MTILRILLFGLFFFICFSDVLPLVAEQGKWEFNISQSGDEVRIYRDLDEKTPILWEVQCTPKPDPHVNLPLNVTIEWTLVAMNCCDTRLQWLFTSDEVNLTRFIQNRTTPSPFYINYQTTVLCNGPVYLDEFHLPENNSKLSNSSEDTSPTSNGQLESPDGKRRLFTITENALYFLIFNITSDDNRPFTARLNIEMKGTHGYLSANQWLPFVCYGVLLIVHVAATVLWVALCLQRQNDLLKIHVWISVAVFITMVEKVLIFHEYDFVNNTGQAPSPQTIFIVGFVTALQCTLTRVLAVLIGRGYGVLEYDKYKFRSYMSGSFAICAVGFFIFASLHTHALYKGEVLNFSKTVSSWIWYTPLVGVELFAGILVLFILIETENQIWSMGNSKQEVIYGNFNRVMVLIGIVAFCFTLPAFKWHIALFCSTDWKGLWLDNVLWHFISTAILFSIMIIWRPTSK